MLKDVIIYINGLQYAEYGSGAEPVQVIAPGEYYYKNGSHYLLYDEVGNGPDDTYKNILKFRPEYLEVIKNGLYNTRLVFEKNKKTLSQYLTPIGTMYVGISTKSIKLNELEDSIELTANYEMNINSSFMADCSISLIAKSRDHALNLTN